MTASLALGVDGPDGPKVLKVLKFDSGSAAEGCGIARRVMIIKSRLHARLLPQAVGQQPSRHERVNFKNHRARKACQSREALIKSLSDFILEFLFNARNKSTRIASYLRRLMTKHWIKIHMKFDSFIESAFIRIKADSDLISASLRTFSKHT